MKSSDLAELALAFQRSRVFLTAYELGVFTAIGRRSRSSSEVSGELGSARRHTDRLMNALCALGLLRKRGGRFSNTPLSLKYLVRGSPDFLKGIGHSVNMWDTWSGLTDTIRRGAPAMGRAIGKRPKAWVGAFIAAMHERACQSAPAVVRMLDLSGVSRVLDVGGGSGAYAMAFAESRKDITAAVFDLPNVVSITKKYTKARGLSGRVAVRAGDYNSDDLGRSYDLAFLSAIIHINSPRQNMALMRKTAAALRPGGRVVIQDFIIDENRVTPAMHAFFALNMLAATESGDTYTESEVRGWVEKAGFADIMRKDTRFGTTLIIGRK